MFPPKGRFSIDFFDWRLLCRSMSKSGKVVNQKICLIYNFAQHYRTAIFTLMDRQLNCSFYFGDRMDDLKKMDYSVLKNFKKELKNIELFKPIYFQTGVIPLFFKRYDTYIILGEYYCISTWILLILCKFSKKKIFLWSHGWYGNEGLVKRFVKKIFFKLADGLLLYGNYAKNLMINEGFKPDKISVLNNSLDYQKQVATRQHLSRTAIFSDHFKNDFPVLIFIGRLTKVKKLDQLIEAYNGLWQKGIKVNLVIVGKGEVESDLRRKIPIGLENSVWFYGECYQEREIAELIYNSTICVSPGNVGLTAMHSLVYGTPVITHNNFPNQMPEFEAIIPGKTGDFFEENNVDDLMSQIQRWLIKVQRNEDIKQNCYDIIDKFYNPKFQLGVISKAIV